MYIIRTHHMIQTILSGTQEDIKQLTKKAYNDVGLRKQWSSQPDIWKAIVNRLKQDKLVSVMQFANNLSACDTAGQCALGSGFCAQLLELEFGAEERLRWQILSNLSFGFPKQLNSKELEDLADQLNAAQIPTSNFLPILILASNIVDSCQVYQFVDNILDKVLTQVPVWMEESQPGSDRTLSVLTQLLSTIITSDQLIPIMTPFIEDKHGKLLTLLKLVDACSLKCPQEYWTTEPGAQILDIFLGLLRNYSEHLIPFMSTTQRNPNVLMLWNLVCVLLDMATSLLPEALPEMTERYRTTYLPTLIELLKSAKQLPQKSKLQQGDAIDPSDLPYMRSKSLSLIAILVKSSWESQELMRNTGGLAAVLECCVIDGNNPFMKESAIMCIRYILQNNQENQNFVAALEAKQVVNPEVLEKSGYEVQIKDGKIVVNNK